jgi:hypothetical protein
MLRDCSPRLRVGIQQPWLLMQSPFEGLLIQSPFEGLLMQSPFEVRSNKTSFPVRAFWVAPVVLKV